MATALSNRLLDCCAPLNSSHNAARSTDDLQQGDCDEAIRSPGTPSVGGNEDDECSMLDSYGFLEQPSPPNLVAASPTSLTLSWQPSFVTGAASGQLAALNARLRYQLEYQKVLLHFFSPLFLARSVQR